MRNVIPELNLCPKPSKEHVAFFNIHDILKLVEYNTAPAAGGVSRDHVKHLFNRSDGIRHAESIVNAGAPVSRSIVSTGRKLPIILAVLRRNESPRSISDTADTTRRQNSAIVFTQ